MITLPIPATSTPLPNRERLRVIATVANPTTRAALYPRVSTPDQEEEGTSLESQEAAIRALCVQRGYVVDERHVYPETHTGKDFWERRATQPAARSRRERRGRRGALLRHRPPHPQPGAPLHLCRRVRARWRAPGVRDHGLRGQRRGPLHPLGQGVARRSSTRRSRNARCAASAPASRRARSTTTARSCTATSATRPPGRAGGLRA